jgi:hypothetical protein
MTKEPDVDLKELQRNLEMAFDGDTCDKEDPAAVAKFAALCVLPQVIKELERRRKVDEKRGAPAKAAAAILVGEHIRIPVSASMVISGSSAMVEIVGRLAYSNQVDEEQFGFIIDRIMLEVPEVRELKKKLRELEDKRVTVTITDNEIEE